MSAEIVHISELKAHSAVKSLSIEIDDFSVKVVSSEDHFFWVRIEANNRGEIEITDFNPGNLPLLTLNIALRKALGEIRNDVPDNLTFKNISQYTSNPQVTTTDYEGPLNIIRSACEALARVSCKAVSSFRVVPDGPKFHVRVALN